MLTLALLLAAAPAASAPSSAHKLSLKTLVLYENGLGYFERKGTLPEGATADIPLEPGQLDDALKSMVVLSDQGVASVEFAPPLAEEAARSLAALPSADEQRSLEAVIRSLKGVEVKVTPVSGAALKGRVLEISDEQEDHDKDGHPLPTPTLMVFGENGLARVRLHDIVSVRPSDPAVQLAWDRALQADATQPDRQTLKVRGAHGGGNVAVGYTTEAAVWRTTYRLVVAGREKAAGRLQGFGLVHNDSDEPWEGVKVSLVSGHPASFLFPLAGPRYSRRELVSPQDGLDVSPQLTSEEAREHLRGPRQVAGASGLGMIGTGSGGGGMGYGVGSASLGRVGTVGRGAGEMSEILEGGPTPLDPAAVSEAGELFLYHVKEPVFLAPRRSALLPIIDTKVTAEPITLVDPRGTSLGVRLTNDTALTLEEGTLSIFTDSVYAGEAQLDRVKPKEVRVIRHGQDLDLNASSYDNTARGPVRQARINGQMLEVHRVNTLSHVLSLDSRSERPRTVLFELPQEGYRVVSGAEEDVRSPGQPRYARLKLEPHEKKDVTVNEEGSFRETIALDSIAKDRVDQLLEGAPEEVKKLLLAVRAEVVRRDTAAQQVAEVNASIIETEKDLARVRDNLAAAGKGGASKTAEKLGEQMMQLEQKLAGLRSRVKDLGVAQEAARKALVSIGSTPKVATAESRR
ncbi:MAG: hypothetical protein QM723_17365 [Myxococcaceae bacterium]